MIAGEKLTKRQGKGAGETAPPLAAITLLELASSPTHTCLVFVHRIRRGCKPHLYSSPALPLLPCPFIDWCLDFITAEKLCSWLGVF